MKVAMCAVLTVFLVMSGCGSKTPPPQQSTQPTGSASSSFVSGYIYPKYQILQVDYAPPGSGSSVTYPINGNVCGASTINSGSFASGVAISTEAAVFDAVLGNYLQRIDTSYSAAIGLTPYNSGLTFPGPADSSLGVDHDMDIVTIWLNPAVKLTITGPASVRWDGYANNPAESSGLFMDIIYLYVAQLKDPSLIPPNVASVLARSWDTSGVGGLTNEDYAAILAADPFSSASYDPTTDSSHRFDLQNISDGGSVVSYAPPLNGGQPVSRTFTVYPTNPNSIKKGASYTYNVPFSVGGGSAEFNDFVKNNLKVPTAYTTTNTWNSMVANSSSATLFNITGPAVSDNYTGPTIFRVWRDNIYGSYMFYP